MTAIEITLVASTALNAIALLGWWHANSDTLHAESYAAAMRRERDRAWEQFCKTHDELTRTRLDWPRRDPVTGRYTKKG